MLIISHNVNGIRSAISKGFLQWLAEIKPDIVCLQEIKANHEQIPILLFEELGYHTFWHSADKKGYSGVAILSLQKPLHVEYGMGNRLYDVEGRIIRVDFENLSVVSAYHPSGTTGEARQAFKMQWLDDFYVYTEMLRKKRGRLLISGDFNICHKEIDIHDPIRNAKNSGFLPEERDWMTKFLKSGFIDTFRHFNKQPHNYSWWSYRPGVREKNLGWRIDYHMATENLLPVLHSAGIWPDVIHSDHCPVWLKFSNNLALESSY